MDQMFELSVEEMEKVAGGYNLIYNSTPSKELRTRDDSHGDGGATDGW